MKLSRAEVLALAEFAGIKYHTPQSIQYTYHINPTVEIKLSDYLFTAEGALRLLSANGWGFRVWTIPIGSDASFDPSTIIAAALQLPSVQELVKKYQGEM